MRDSNIAFKKVFPIKNQNKIDNSSIDSLEIYEWIIKNPGYGDFMPRTIKGLKKEKIEKSLDALAKEVFRYFHCKTYTNYDYDTWHKRTCEAFIDNVKKDGFPIKYGKAQKILNMTMKYLYCLPDAQKYCSKFKPCHMPLDSFTLEWFCDRILPICDENRKSDVKVTKTKIMDTSWSNLECGDKDIKYSYFWIQKQIRNHLQDLKDKNEDPIYYDDKKKRFLTPFEAEFYIWPEQQLHEAYQQITAVLEKTHPVYYDEEMYNNCKDVIRRLEEFQNELSAFKK